MRRVSSVLIFAAASLLAASTWMASAQAQQKQPPSTTPHAQMKHETAKPGATGKMTMDCQQMMQMHQKMMADMKDMDTRLDTLVQQMNAATGQAKVDATAAVVSEMVTQRKQMHEGMQSMQANMMQHMMEHMQAGGPQSMMQCPMMRQK